MELKIYNQTALEPIQFNYEELVKELTGKLAYYKSVVYTEAEVKTAKTDRATLNKFKDAIDNRRKEIKAQCMQPYLDFENKTKEILRMIEEPVRLIDGQIKAFEKKVQDEKKASIEAFYAREIGDLKELLPLTRFWNPKWLNASYAIKTIKEEITATITKVKADFEVISGFKSEFEFQIKDVYLRTFDLSKAMTEKTRLEEQRAKQEAYAKAQAERQAEIERQRAEREREAEKIRVEAEIKAAIEMVKTELDPMVVPDGCTVIETPESTQEQTTPPEPQLIKIDFRIWVTGEQLQLLKAFLIENNIKYGRVE